MNSKGTARKIALPLTPEVACDLKAGEFCLLSGTLYTLRDAGHVRLLDEMQELGKLPYDLAGQVIFYAGPTPEREGASRPFGAIGPTTSSRMDFAAPELYDAGIIATLGKGVRSPEVHDACIRNNAVYFVTVGGAAAALAECVTATETISYHDLGTEAFRRIEVKDFPVFVGIDTSGNDIYELARS